MGEKITASLHSARGERDKRQRQTGFFFANKDTSGLTRIPFGVPVYPSLKMKQKGSKTWSEIGDGTMGRVQGKLERKETPFS